MVQFLKFKFLIALKWNFNGGQFYEYVCKYQNLVISKSEKSHIKNVKFEVENLHSNTTRVHKK